MTHAFALKMTVTIGLASAALAATLQCGHEAAAKDPLASAIARQESRVEAARASLNAKPVIGESHLPPYDARTAVARETAELRRLWSLRSATR